MDNNRIVLTGGGSAGHVIPNLPLIQRLKSHQWQIYYIGSYHGIERQLIEEQGVEYSPISTGKLRRYFSWQNFIDPLRIFVGILQALVALIKIRPKIIFSKGGFVAFPVVFSGWLLRIPVIAHESDMTPGLANRLCYPFVKKLCVTFEKAKDHFSDRSKIVVTGTPIREELLKGNKSVARSLCGFTQEKPCLLIIGGSLGAEKLNQLTLDNLEALLTQFNVIHLCGKGKVSQELSTKDGYKAFEYVKKELADLYALADYVISRSGANSVYEILTLQKPHIFIPLSSKVSRGDQIANANYFKHKGISFVLDEDLVTNDSFLSAINEMVASHDDVINAIKTLAISSATITICNLIEQS